MTIAAFAPPRSGIRAVPARFWRLADEHLLPGLVAAALFVLSRPYGGLDGDARLYFGHVLADADPKGVGADFYFADNDQFGFSLFPALVRPFVLHLGPSIAGVLIAAAANLCCFAALVALAWSLAPKGANRAGWLVVLFVTVLPVSFGTPSMFDFAETAAVPRPFAEAAVVAALACLLRGHFGWSLVFVAAGLLIHPIMGLVGLAVVALVILGRLYGTVGCAFEQSRRRRWFVCALAIASFAALVIVAIVGHHIPLFDRLFVCMDPTWLTLVVHRSFHLFPTRWMANEYANLFVEAVTIAIAARAAAPAVRAVLVAILVATLGAMAASCLLGDVLHNLLFVQAQLWRSVWLIEVVAAAALALCVPALARRNEAGRLALILLALGWVFVADVPLAIACAAAAAVLQFDGGRLSSRIRRHHVVTVGGAAVVASLAWTIGATLAVLHVRAMQAAGTPVPFGAIWHLNAQTIPIAMLASWWAWTPTAAFQGLGRRTAAAGGLGLLVVGLASWDARDRSQVALDGRQQAPAFEALAAGRPPEVLWIDGGSEAWMALGRPQWLSHLQAVGIVFSRPLALEGQRRADIALAYGLARPSLLHLAFAKDALTMTEAGVSAFCRLPGAPGTIVLPVRPGVPALPGLAGSKWRPDGAGAGLFEIIPCAARGSEYIRFAPPQQRPSPVVGKSS